MSKLPLSLKERIEFFERRIQFTREELARTHEKRKKLLLSNEEEDPLAPLFLHVAEAKIKELESVLQSEIMWVTLWKDELLQKSETKR